jgi:uroporphyrinogen-III decarboxylase
MTRRRFVPRFERYDDWSAACGDIGLPYAVLSFSGLGFLISRFMGIERTVYALHDHPREMKEIIDQVNDNTLEAIDLLCRGPADVIFLTDNFSSDVQPPALFERWSAAFYREAARRIHAAGKYLSVHVDGRLKGLLRAMAGVQVDCIDAVTPAPMGDLTPEECREEAGPDMILWGGIPPSLWSRSNTSDEAFVAAIRRWLDLRHASPRLVLAPGDQVPPDTDRYRIEMVAEMCETYGRY